jgi:hypothetical protein
MRPSDEAIHNYTRLLHSSPTSFLNSPTSLTTMKLRQRKVNETERLLALSTTHKNKSQITKAKATKQLHMIASQAFHSLHHATKATSAKVTIPLELLSESLLETAEELESAEEKSAELQRILWEGRYCDYIAAGLIKVRATAAWQSSEEFGKLKWGVIRGFLTVRNAQLDELLERVAKEVKFPVEALRAWIGLYVDRCQSKYHHAGFAELLERSNINGVRKQILADQVELSEVTPQHMQAFIPHIRIALQSYRDDLFEVFADEWVLTKHGKKMAKLEKKKN